MLLWIYAYYFSWNFRKYNSFTIFTVSGHIMSFGKYFRDTLKYTKLLPGAFRDTVKYTKLLLGAFRETLTYTKLLLGAFQDTLKYSKLFLGVFQTFFNELEFVAWRF